MTRFPGTALGALTVMGSRSLTMSKQGSNATMLDTRALAEYESSHDAFGYRVQKSECRFSCPAKGSGLRLLFSASRARVARSDMQRNRYTITSSMQP